MGSVPQSDDVRKGLTVCICVALELVAGNQQQEWRSGRYKCGITLGLCYKLINDGETPTSASVK